MVQYPRDRLYVLYVERQWPKRVEPVKFSGPRCRDIFALSLKN